MNVSTAIGAKCMSIDPKTIALGKCYITTTEQVRKVLEIEDGKVKYVSRGRKILPDWEKGSFVWVNDEKFADDVDREVNCDWEEGYPEREPT